MKKVFLFLMLLLFSARSVAEEVIPFDNDSDQVEEKADKEKEKVTFERRFIDTNIAISEWFDGLAEGLDYFLIGEKLTNTPNQTKARIQNQTFTEEGRSPRNFTSIGVFPRFPNLEKYWSLKFTTYDEKEDDRGVGNTYLRQTPRRQNYGATVGFFRKVGDIKTSFEPRIELQDPLKVSHSLGFENVTETKYFDINPKLELFASATKGTGVYQAINFNFELSKRSNLTLINEGTYEDRARTFNAYNGFSVGHILTRKSTLSYGLIFNSVNRPDYHLEGYSFSIGLSQLVYRRILDFQLVPHLDFSRAYDFKGRIGMNFTVNLNF